VSVSEVREERELIEVPLLGMSEPMSVFWRIS